MSNTCIICNSKENNKIFTEYGIDVLRCGKCGHVYSSYEQEQDYEKYFSNDIGIDDHFWWGDAHGRMYKDFSNNFLINKSGRMLDVGCGLGYFVKFASKHKDWEAYGYEISEPAVKYAREKLSLGNIGCGKVENSCYPDNHFDIITLWDVVEHLPDPYPVLNYLHNILKPGGILFIHTPNIKVQLPKARIKKMIYGINKDGHYLEAKDHINIYSQKTMVKVLKKCGFNIIKFIHLHPIQSVSGSKLKALRELKNLWFHISCIIFYISFKKINLDNLFVVARK